MTDFCFSCSSTTIAVWLFEYPTLAFLALNMTSTSKLSSGSSVPNPSLGWTSTVYNNNNNNNNNNNIDSLFVLPPTYSYFNSGIGKNLVKCLKRFVRDCSKKHFHQQPIKSEEQVSVLANLRGNTRRVSDSFYPIKPSANTHEYSESNRASKYVMLLSNFEDEHRGLSPSWRRDFAIDWYMFLDCT